MRGAAVSLALIASATPVLAEAPSPFVAGLIAEAKAGAVFADASTGAEPRARHLASGVVCRFEAGQPATIRILPGRDNVGCTMARGSGVLSLQVQRVPEGVDAGKFLADMTGVVRADFPGATPIAASEDSASALKAARFAAVFQGRPVYVEVSAIHTGPWMVSAHIVAPRRDAEAADRITRTEVQAAAKQAAR